MVNVTTKAARKGGAWLLGAALVMAPALASAEIVRQAPTGFEISHRHEVAASPAQVYEALTRLPQWWNSAHTWSGNAAHMSLDLQAGGCWCERWGGQSVMHGQVVWVNPGNLIRLNAALGPLQDRAINGVLTLVTTQQEGVTRLRLSYRVAGAEAAELDKLAPAVDKVLAEQVQRLLKFIATGRPE